MKILPAIDIKDGKCVRLVKGDFSRSTTYNNSPIKQAEEFKNLGFDFLHIIDLDGASEGYRINIDIVDQIIQNFGLKVQLGGGIREINDIKKLLDKGVERVVLGTAIIENRDFLSSVLTNFNQKNLTFALDFRMFNKCPLISTRGWSHQTEINLFDFIKNFNLKNILATDINLDGILKGPNIEIYKKITDLSPSSNIIGSGGISCIDDVNRLSKINISECIVGKAIYEKKIDLMDLSNVN